jgi:F-type H+-transporting ATPase subunit a
MLPVELVGMFTKPFALTVRLFANIAAGHLMILALIGLIFILGKGGSSIGAGLGIAPLTVAFGIFVFCLEVLVAAVQAYVFTLLTAVFIGQAMEDHSHDHHEAEAHAHH